MQLIISILFATCVWLLIFMMRIENYVPKIFITMEIASSSIKLHFAIIEMVLDIIIHNSQTKHFTGQRKMPTLLVLITRKHLMCVSFIAWNNIKDQAVGKFFSCSLTVQLLYNSYCMLLEVSTLLRYCLPFFFN